MRNNALAVPQVAVLDGPQGKFVYVADKDKDGKDIAARAPGRRSANGSTQDGANLWIVESGLKAGDQVIVDGVAKLRPGAPIKLGGAPRRAGAPAAAAPGRPPDSAARGRQVGAQGVTDGDPPCSRASSSTGRSSRPSSRMFLVLAGLAAMRTLPIAQYPEIAPPVVTVQAVYPGASAEVLEQTVAAPIENAINGVPSMIYMSSTSASNGVVQIQVTFEIGTNVDTPRSTSTTASSRSSRGCPRKCAARA